jgi:hypothetical protein
MMLAPMANDSGTPSSRMPHHIIDSIAVVLVLVR